MDKDLEFLIGALSRSESPVWRNYSRDQLMEMRESFVMLRDLLRHKTMKEELVPSHPVRFKAGGNTNCKSMATDLPPTVPLLKFPLHANAKPQPSTTSLASLPSVYETASLYSGTDLESSSHDQVSEEKQEVARQGDDETSTDNFLAMVPYQKQEPSQELVLYEPPPEQDDDDDFDTATMCGSEISISVSGSGSSARSPSSVGEISISIPMQMEYVWHNMSYHAESTDSDMTITADGFNYILNN